MTHEWLQQLKDLLWTASLAAMFAAINTSMLHAGCPARPFTSRSSAGAVLSRRGCIVKAQGKVTREFKEGDAGPTNPLAAEQSQKVR